MDAIRRRAGTVVLGPHCLCIEQKEGSVRTLFGMMLGCLLTIGIVYMHDMSATSSVSSGTNVSDSRTIVNWNVASDKWDRVTQNAKHAFARLKQNVS